MAGRPLDKRSAEDPFECHELAADGGQGKTQLTACCRQVPSIRNLNEHSHRRELIHGRIIAKNGKMSRQIPEYSPKPGGSMCLATDTWGTTATSTRTIIIETAPSIVPTTTASSSPPVQ